MLMNEKAEEKVSHLSEAREQISEYSNNLGERLNYLQSRRGILREELEDVEDAIHTINAFLSPKESAESSVANIVNPPYGKH